METPVPTNTPVPTETPLSSSTPNSTVTPSEKDSPESKLSGTASKIRAGGANNFDTYDNNDDKPSSSANSSASTPNDGQSKIEPTKNPPKIPVESEDENRPSNDTNSPSSGSTEVVPPTSTEGRTIYITSSGKRYHYDNRCNGGTYYPSTLEEAQRLNLTPCNKCVQ